MRHETKNSDEVWDEEPKTQEKLKNVGGKVTKCPSYPSIYFYNLEAKRVDWEIFGATAFIDFLPKADDV